MNWRHEYVENGCVNETDCKRITKFLRDQLAAKDKWMKDALVKAILQTNELNKRDKELAELREQRDRLGNEYESSLIEIKQLREQLKETQEAFQIFKKGMAKGTELYAHYAHLRIDDQPFTPYQLALQEIKELKEALRDILPLAIFWDCQNKENGDREAIDRARKLLSQ